MSTTNKDLLTRRANAVPRGVASSTPILRTARKMQNCGTWKAAVILILAAVLLC